METLTTISPVFDVENIREMFPILSRELNDKTLVYLDNAATSQKPQVVIDALSNYYSHYNANIHRGIHTLALIMRRSPKRSFLQEVPLKE